MHNNNNYGFTLIEIAVIIVLAGIAVAVMVPFLGSALTRSHEPIDNLGHATALSSQMAKVQGAYNSSMSCGDLEGWDIVNLPGFDANHATLDLQRLCYFDLADTLVCDGGQTPVVLQVRLRSVRNPGEFLTYYFPCEPL